MTDRRQAWLWGVGLLWCCACPVSAAKIRVYASTSSEVWMRPSGQGDFQKLDGDTPLVVDVASGELYDFKAVARVSFFEIAQGEHPRVMAGGDVVIAESNEIDTTRVGMVAMVVVAMGAFMLGARSWKDEVTRQFRMRFSPGSTRAVPQQKTAVAPSDQSPATLEAVAQGGTTMPQSRQRGQLAPGDRVGSYEILRVISRGGMGTVYEVTDARGLHFALKSPHAAVLEDETALVRFHREIEIVRQLHHPNIVQIHDFSLEDPAFILLELVSGPPLSEVMEAERPMELVRAVTLVRATLAALEYGHQRGVLHRDVKPANILLQDGSTPKLTDYGIARLHDATRVTATQAAIGTPVYMAPEQLNARSVDQRADVYSAGVILFEAVTGQRPFEADDYIVVLAQKLVNEPPRASAFRPGLPPQLDMILYRAMATEPDNRYPSAQAFINDLEALGI
ncbi:MAG TPA: serine/threonine-protein kinase [Candidatus Xenobia bacterium]